MRRQRPILYWSSVALAVIGIGILMLGPLEGILGVDIVDDPNPILTGALLAGAGFSLLASGARSRG